MGKFNEYSQKATPEDIEVKQAFAVQRSLELDCWEIDQCGHQ